MRITIVLLALVASCRPQLFGGLGRAVGGLADGVRNTVGQTVGAVNNVASGVVKDVGNVASGVGQGVGNVVGAVNNAATGAVKGVGNVVGGVVSGVDQLAAGGVADLVGTVLSTVASLAVNDSSPYTLNPDEWWGPEENKGKVDTSIREDPIRFDDETITDLRNRLQNHVAFKPPLKGAAFTYGFNTNELDEWIQYWANDYPFKQREDFLNQFPQFKTNIQGLDIHFIHVKPQNPNNKEVVPLLLLHGWPGSIREFYEAIPLLTADSPDRDFVVEVIVPCLPGFGFSDAAVRPGMGGNQVAVIMKNLMNKLGFERFYVQGGDWGGVIAAAMTVIFQEEVLGFHCNWALSLAGAPASLVPLVKYLPYVIEETGYVNLAASRPDSVGVALTDSPAGLLAFIMEKFATGANPEKRFQEDGGLYDTFTPEKMIDDLMIYWTTKSITTSFRLYAETLNKKSVSLGIEISPTKVPTWVTQGKYELTHQPDSVLRLKYPNLLHNEELSVGGHFLALERPQEFSASVLEAIAAFIKYHQNGDRLG
ncbi:alpha/beta hydrolase fold domain-containing protein [Phthorimaea operculella]|nr:alpha/beta hydrolase fold domain-containing protein [Phthorimaea operculella]